MPVHRTVIPAHRCAAVLALVLLGLITPGCDTFYFEPEGDPSRPDALSVAFDFAAPMADASTEQVVNLVDQILVEISDVTDDSLLWRGAVPFTATADELVLEPIEIDLPEEGTLRIAVDLLWQEASLFRGSTEVRIEPGVAVTAPTIIVSASPADLVIDNVDPLTSLGATAQAVARVLFATSHPIPDAQVTWSSDAPGVASVNALGVVTAVSEGSASIIASYEHLTATELVTVGVPVHRIVVSPSNPDLLSIGASISFAAVPLSEAGDVLNRLIEWDTSDSTVVAVTASGAATALASGTAEITAKTGGVSVSVQVTVLGEAVGITTLPATSIGASTVSLTGQFPAGGGATAVWFEYGTNQGLPTSTGTPPLAAPSGDGVFTATLSGLAAGTSYYFRALAAVGTDTLRGGVRAFSTLNSAPLVDQVLISPTAPVATVGDTVLFNAVALDSLGGVLPGGAAVWTTSDPSVAVIEPSGKLVVVGPGTSVVQGNIQGVAGTTVLSANPLPPILVNVTPSTAAGQIGDTIQFAAVALNALDEAVPSSFTWTSSNGAVASVDQTGAAVVVGAGTATITADIGLLFGVATVTGIALPAVAMAVSPTNPSAPVGDTVLFTAVAKNVLGEEVPVTFTWASSQESVASINALGAATVLSEGATTITASTGSLSATTVLSATPAPITEVVVSPSDTSSLIGTSLLYGASAINAVGDTVDATFVWSSSDPAVATVDASGTVNVLAVGTTSITAQVDSISGSGTLAALSSGVTTLPVSDIKDKDVKGNGEFIQTPGHWHGYFEYAAVNDPSQFVASNDSHLNVEDGSDSWNEKIDQLEPSTTYYYRAVVLEQDTGEVRYGPVRSFTTAPG